VNKLNVFTSFVFSSGYLVFCCTETWLTDAIFDNEIIACGYCIYRKDRLSRGGGILIAVNQSISSAEVESPRELEVVCVSVGSRNLVKLCAVYISICPRHLSFMAGRIPYHSCLLN